ncbi:MULTISPECIES: hypothetical protein [unclassified Pseudoalteromonas]|uniref:hypothetical protein n=1 Tax=unclassified Pseudoalteromonas TaxID=194690 RepID=UPI000231624F|nr:MULTISPECIES: hypothetical protein [unclassified Pseudoalteromonas]MBB1445214.1 hypothetical protein [Pseudoalteromonas sp. SG43-3]MBB1452324.1 hypothetical protein [Pseudoalteromonas sp. SG43-1]GAA79624.1 hypothetical protein P20495_2126 [Pseudoalteromonas sp. BSi20495]
MKKAVRVKLILYISLFIGLIIFPFSLFKGWIFIAYPSLLIGFTIPFILLLEHDIEKFLKGIFLILYGIFWGAVIPEVFSEYMNGYFAQQFEIFKNLALFSCTGAGGSIIASHSETESKNKKIEKVVIDKTEKIEELICSIDKLRKITYRIHAIYGVIIILVILIIVSNSML